MAHCPRCGSQDVMGEKITLPSTADDGSRRVAYDYFCRNCKLAEGGVAGEPGFDELYQRWEGELGQKQQQQQQQQQPKSRSSA